MRKTIYTIFATFAMLFALSAANAQTVIVYFTVDMSAAMLGECATTTPNSCTNGVACAIIPFDPSIDVVEPMGGEYNGWSAPETTSGCGAAFTPGVQDMQPVSPGSLVYTISDDTLHPDANHQTSFKFRIDHSWDNDEIRGEGSGGNRVAKLPTGATSVLIACVFDDTLMTISDVSGINTPVQAQIQKVYPNPSSDISRIAYNVLQAGNVQVYISDAAGRKVMTLVNENLPLGTHEAQVNTGDLAPGVYLVTVQVGISRATQKLTVVR